MWLRALHPKTLKVAALLDKPSRRCSGGLAAADYVAFEVPDIWVVGYGMDVAYAFRELPFVGIVTGDA